MFKKLLIASVVLAGTTSIAFAHVSYKGERRDYKAEVVPPCPCYQYVAGPYLGLNLGVRDNISGAPAAYKGIEGTISAGYAGMLSPQFYLAAEVFAGDSFRVKDYTRPGSGSARSTWSYGLDIIPGVMLTDYVLGYLRAGVIQTRFNNVGVNKTGWQVGIGGQTNLCGNWDLRGEYVYSQYGNVSTVGHVLADQFNIGIVYKFV